MSSPITWQNVQGRSLAEAATPMQAASQSILGGFDRMGKVFDQYQGMEQKKLDLADEANVQGFLDRLQRASTPEEVAALQASGELDAMRAGIGTKNLARVRGAEDTRVAGLMQQMGARQEFGDKQTDRTEAPIREAYNLAVLNKDEAAQKAIRDANPNLRGWDKLVGNEQATERKFLEQDRADRMAPLTEANAVAEAELKKIALGTAKETAADAAEQKRLETRLAAEQQAYLGQQAERGQKLGMLAKKMGFPTDMAGNARVSDMTTEQLARLDNEAILSGLPTVKDVTGSDTEKADNVFAALTESGEFSARALQKNRDGIRKSFASNGLSGAVGGDAAAIDRVAAQQKVLFDEIDKNNWNAPGNPTVRESYESLAKDVPAILDKTSGIDAEEDVPAIQEFVHEMATVGLEVKPGVFMTPSVNDIRAAIRSAQGGWFKDSTRTTNIRESLKEMAQKPEFNKRMEEAGQSTEYRRKQAVKDILNSK